MGVHFGLLSIFLEYVVSELLAPIINVYQYQYIKIQLVELNGSVYSSFCTLIFCQLHLYQVNLTA